MVEDTAALNVHAAGGVAVREFPLLSGHGTADYVLYVDGRAAGVVEAKPVGHTLTRVETQSGKYGAGLPDNLPCYVRPLPFLYESTGMETRFTNGLDPQPRSRNVFSFHTPDTLAEWLGGQDASAEAAQDGPELIADAGWRLPHPAQPAPQTVPDASAGRLQPRGSHVVGGGTPPTTTEHHWEGTHPMDNQCGHFRRQEYSA